jgi:hypothetical protein
MASLKSLLSIPDATRILLGPSVNPKRGYDLAARGLMPGVVRIGRLLRVDPDKLAAFIDAGGRSLAGDARRDASGETADR